jgi:hypothetical protein
MWTWLKNLIGLLIGVLLLLSAAALANALTRAASDPSHFIGRVAVELLGWNAKGVINVFLAGIVGVLGSIAFYYGVYTGFIGRSNRAETLQYLSGSTNRFHYIAMFYVLGGVVAGVFQAAQFDTFAPIQAFVLGATWPSVVTRIMSGSSSGVESARSLADKPPDEVPRVTTDKKTADAQVVL